MAAVARAIGHMNPGKITLVDSLIDRQLQLHEQVIETGVVETTAHGDVGSLAFHVLAAWRSSHGPVQCRAAITAVHMYGAAPCLAQGVEHMLHKAVQVLDSRGWRSVVNAHTASGC